MAGVEESIMKFLFPVVAALACTSVMATSVTAEQPRDDQIRETKTTETKTTKAIPAFETLDRNSDGQISRTEAGYDRQLSKGFAFLDTNGDGFLSREEYAAWANQT
jgi:hypothetical protein